MRFALLLALAISVSHSQAAVVGCTEDVVKVIKENSGDWILILMLTTVFALGLIYIVATAFNRIEYIVLVKDELITLGVSLCILMLFGTVMTVSCSFTAEAFNYAYAQVQSTSATALLVEDPCYVPGEVQAVQKISSCYMGLMESDANNLIKIYTKKNIELQLDASGMVNYFGILKGTTFGPEAYKRSWAQFADSMNTMFVLPAYVSIKAQDLFVRFFVGLEDGSGSLIFSFFLPGAFMLRFFPPLRQMGNMLIALTIGIYLVVPFFIALNGMTYVYVFGENDKEAYAFLLKDLVVEDDLLNIARLYPQAFLLPNLVIAIFITFISSISKALKVFG